MAFMNPKPPSKRIVGPTFGLLPLGQSEPRLMSQLLLSWGCLDILYILFHECGGLSATFEGKIPAQVPKTLPERREFRGYLQDIWKISGPKKMKHGNRGKKLFVVAIAFFWSVLVLKKSQKNYFGGRFSPTPVVGMWCPAL